MIQKVHRKALDIKFSGRSSDYITPSFGFGCLYKCAYCYMRRHRPTGLSIAENTEDILDAVVKHHNTLGKKQPNQTHPSKWTYDISCNEDFALHAKHHKFEKILDTIQDIGAFPTLATKHVSQHLHTYKPKYGARIRFSLMPQQLSTILEPNTSLISHRIKAVNSFIERGWDVHLNFSPVIFNPGTGKMYEELFKEVNSNISNLYKHVVKAEVIMLTHNSKMHEYNLEHAPIAEEILWQPDRQEIKTSSYGSKNLRYKWQDKANYIKQFKQLHSEIIPWNEIRYIF